MMFRSLLRGAFVASALLSAPAAFAQALVGAEVVDGVPSYGPGMVKSLSLDQTGALRVSIGGGPSGGSAAVNITRISCTLPQYSQGGNAVCTNESGTQTTTACAANTACLIAAANANRKYAFASGGTPGASVSLGYTATVAPGNSRAVDGPSAPGGQGGFYEWQSPPTNAIYAASATNGAIVVFEQGQ